MIMQQIGKMIAQNKLQKEQDGSYNIPFGGRLLARLHRDKKRRNDERLCTKSFEKWKISSPEHSGK